MSVELTRTVSVSAAHRLHSPHLTDKENADLYGKCNNPKGHGHNYLVEVTVKGFVDPRTGMVMNLTDLKRYLDAAVSEPLDHKNIDEDVPYFKTVVSTTENVTIFIWNSLQQVMSKEHRDRLYRVTVHETDKNRFTYYGP